MLAALCLEIVMSDKPLFQNTDEQEIAYAPQELPGAEQARVRADEGADRGVPGNAEPPSAGLVANVGGTSSGLAATPNAEGRAPDPMDDDRGI
jgi:hypothetical protein